MNRPIATDELDWVTIEEYLDTDNEVTVEGLFLNTTEDDEKAEPDLYQVFFKPPWRLLIAPTEDVPTASDIHSAIKLAVTPPEMMYHRACTNLLQGLFVRILDMNKERGYCIVCGKTEKSGGHESGCILWQAVNSLHAQIQWKNRQG